MSAIQPYHGLTLVEAVPAGADRALRLAAAMAGRIFADLGARVVSHTALDGEDEAQRLFLSARKVVRHAPIADEAGFDEAVRSADIALVDEWGLARLDAGTRPPLVAVLSLFGGARAERQQPASAFTVSALGGLLRMVGDPEREPLKLAGHQEAYALALSVFCGLAANLAGAAEKPPQATVRASLLDAVIWLNWKAVPFEDGMPGVEGRAGAESEWQVLRCADGYAALVYQEPDWPRLCAALADPRLDDPRFATRPDRLAHARELAAVVEDRFLRMTRREIHALALAHRLPLGPVWSPAEALDDPHNLARRFFEDLPDGDGAPARAPRLPVLWSGDTVARALTEARRPERTVAP